MVKDLNEKAVKEVEKGTEKLKGCLKESILTMENCLKESISLCDKYLKPEVFN